MASSRETRTGRWRGSMEMWCCIFLRQKHDRPASIDHIVIIVLRMHPPGM